MADRGVTVELTYRYDAASARG